MSRKDIDFDLNQALEALKAFMADFKAVYRAATKNAAETAFNELDAS